MRSKKKAAGNGKRQIAVRDLTADPDVPLLLRRRRPSRFPTRIETPAARHLTCSRFLPMPGRDGALAPSTPRTMPCAAVSTDAPEVRPYLTNSALCIAV